jgi:hypothetical protein
MRIITWFFVGLGLLTFALLSLIGYVWVSDYRSLRSTTMMLYELSVSAPDIREAALPALVDTISPTPVSTGETRAADPASLPISNETVTTTETAAVPVLPDRSTLSFTPEQIDCFRTKLGSDRVDEIYETGAEPTPAELLLGATCL